MFRVTIYSFYYKDLKVVFRDKRKRDRIKMYVGITISVNSFENYLLYLIKSLSAHFFFLALLLFSSISLDLILCRGTEHVVTFFVIVPHRTLESHFTLTEIILNYVCYFMLSLYIPAINLIFQPGLLLFMPWPLKFVSALIGNKIDTGSGNRLIVSWLLLVSVT